MYNVLEWLEASAESYPEKTAAIDELNSISYGELADVSRRIGSGLCGSTCR